MTENTVLFKDKIKKWRGSLRHKEAAALLGVPLGTYRTWEYGKRTPKKLAMAELERLMAEHQNGK